MRSDRVLAVLIAAGAACSVAAAQQQDGLQKGGFASAAMKTSGPLLDGGLVEPIRVEVNGLEVPFTVGGNDSNFELYNNLGANNFISTTHHYRTLDDFGLANGQTAMITGLRPAFGTPAAASSIPTVNVTVEFRFFGTMNPAVTPVNSPPASNWVRVTYAAPAGGWAANTVYTGSAFIISTAGASGPVVSSGGVDVRILRADTFAPHPEFDPAFSGQGVSLGSSTDGVWLDHNGDGIYQGADAGPGNEATNFGGTAGQFANLRLAIQGRYLEPDAGACCLLGGSCVVLKQSQCAGLLGTYNGDGSTCASVPGHCATPPVLHNNGPLSTGEWALNGAAAPAGTTWSEGVQEPPCYTTINGPNGSGTFRLADDFTVPAGKQWAVTKVTTYAYASPGNTTTSPITGFTLRIWNGPPNDPASQVVYGDTTTNLYSAPGASFANMYRIFNTGLLAQPHGLTRPIWKFDVPINVTLQAGTYWLDWNVTGATFAPQVTMMTDATNGVRNAPAANALQWVAAAPAPNTGGGWQLIGDNGGAAGCLAGNYDMPFILEGAETNTGPQCYANCDGSTITPVLNVADFSCFLTKFAALHPYANCDGSTIAPVHNVADFSCFLTKFAAGCP